MKTIQNENSSCFELYSDDGVKIGKIEYKKSGAEEMYATYTEVVPDYEGQGLGMELVDALADYARGSGMRIVAVCPFVVHTFQKYPDKYKDVIK